MAVNGLYIFSKYLAAASYELAQLADTPPLQVRQV